MSGSIVPSRTLLSTFSQCLKCDRSRPFSTQCQRLSTLHASVHPRTTPQSCLHTSTTSRAFRNGRKVFSTTTTTRTYKTVEEQRSRYRSGVRSSAPSPLRISSLMMHEILYNQLMERIAILLESRSPLPRLGRRPDLLLPLRKSSHGT